MSSTPTLPVADIAESASFSERAGFGVRIYCDEHGDGEGGFAFVDLDAASDFEPRASRAACYLITDDAEAWRARMQEAGLSVTPLADQPWGMREFTLTDPAGNHIRIGRSIPDAD